MSPLPFSHLDFKARLEKKTLEIDYESQAFSINGKRYKITVKAAGKSKDLDNKQLQALIQKTLKFLYSTANIEENGDTTFDNLSLKLSEKKMEVDGRELSADNFGVMDDFLFSKPGRSVKDCLDSRINKFFQIIEGDYKHFDKFPFVPEAKKASSGQAGEEAADASKLESFPSEPFVPLSEKLEEVEAEEDLKKRKELLRAYFAGKYEAVEAGGAGNCLFHSMSSLLGAEYSHEVLREKAVDWLEKEASSIELTLSDTAALAENMREEGTYATYRELVALANALEKNIVLLSSKNGLDEIDFFQTIRAAKQPSEAQADLLILYSSASQHYRPVKEKTS